MPRTYDINIDEFRLVTQADVDLMVTTCAAWGLMVEFLRKSRRIRDGEALAIALDAAHSRVTLTAASKALTHLLETTD